MLSCLFEIATSTRTLIRLLCIIASSIWFPAFTSTSKSCNNNLSEYGFALDHVYKSFLADRLVTCYISCNMQPACQSLNYNLADKTCELNNDTKYFRPRHSVAKQHFCMLRTPTLVSCEILPFRPHNVHQSDFCRLSCSC